MTCLNAVKNALLTVSQNVGHYAAFKATPPYIVWAEDGQSGSESADDATKAAVITGTVDLYTKSLNGDPLIDSIPAALEAAGIGWSLNSVQYESETKLLHYEWVWEVAQDYGND